MIFRASNATRAFRGARHPGGDASQPAGTVLGYELQALLAAVVLGLPGVENPPALWYYGVGILALPLLIRCSAGRPLAPIRRAWVTLGLALHPIGVAYGLYGIWWYDHLTHALSATLLAAGGYALGAALGRVRRGQRSELVLHGAMLLFVLASGIAWEVYELFAPHLLVHGAEDTAKDLMFNLVGWAVVARFRSGFLGPAGERLAARIAGGVRRLRPT